MSVDIGLHANYWKGLKEYYETDYNGVAPGKYGEMYAKECESARASFIDMDRPFDPEEVKIWIEETEDEANGGNEFIDVDETSVVNMFPNLFAYAGYEDEIAAYFLLKDLEQFSTQIEKGNQEYVDEAIRLNWTEMIEQIPSVKDMFLF